MSIEQIGYLSDIKKRLFLVNGPPQALNVMAMINEEKPSRQQRLDFVVIGNLSVAKEYNRQIIETTRNILESHDWAQIKDITFFEDELRKLYIGRRFTKCAELIYNMTGLFSVDELYMINNSKSPLTIMAGRVYRQAKVIIYGDAFGIIDSAIGHGFSKIDEVEVFLPVEYNKGFLNHIPYRIMKKETLIDVIDRVISFDSKLDCALFELREKVDNESILLTTVQFAEWNMMDMEHEVCMYVKAVERNSVPGCTVFIKEHPRVTRKDRIELIEKYLIDKGYKCVAIDAEALRFTPVEIICRRVPFKKVISTASTSGISVKYLYDCSVDFGVDTEDISHFRKGDYLRIFTDGMKKALENIDTWDMKSPLYSFDISPHDYLEDPVIIGKKPIITNLTNDEVLSWLISNCFLKGTGLGELFKKRSIRKIAVYGIGVVGKIIAQILSLDNEIELFLIDMNLAGMEYLSKKVYTLKQFDKEVDAVVIAVTHHVDEIKAELYKREVKTKSVITLGDIISFIE